jgi:hypothetical protein
MASKQRKEESVIHRDWRYSNLHIIPIHQVLRKQNLPCVTNTNLVSFVRKCGNNQSKSQTKDDNNADCRFGASISSEKVMSRSVRGFEEIHVRFMVPLGYGRVAFG